MTEKNTSPTSQTRGGPNQDSETGAAVVPFKKGLSASNLLGALTVKPPAQTDSSSAGGKGTVKKS